MIRNYLQVAWRNLLKHKIFTGINLFGLSLSMSVCMILILLISYHYKFDTFHPDGDRVYRITTKTKGETGFFSEIYATSPLLFGKSLKENFSQVEKYCNLNLGFKGEFRTSDHILEMRSVFADDGFFELFGFELVQGNPGSVLSEPYSLVLSESKANLLFPNKEAIGKLVEVADQGTYKVTGILKDPILPSHISFDALGSFATVEPLANKGVLTDEYMDWENIWMNYNYLLLKDEQSKEDVEALMAELAAAHIQLEDDHPGYVFELQKLTEIVPGRPMSNEMNFSLPEFILAFFALLGLIVISTASINYTNLSIAKSLSRAKEIGIRKVNGATRGQIIFQLLVESVLISFLAFLPAAFFYRLLIQQFNEIWIFNIVGIELVDFAGVYGLFLIFTLFVGLITGIGPSLFLSRLKVIMSLKGTISNHVRSRKYRFSSKSLMLGIQFALSIFLLVTIFVLRDQANYFINGDYGFKEKKVFFLPLFNHDHQLVKSEFASIAGVANVSFTSHHPAVGRSYGEEMRVSQGEEPKSIYYFSVDREYIDVMGLELLAGESFPHQVSETEKFTILNELAVERLGFSTSVEAIGQTVYSGENETALKVVGVVKDYHWEPKMKAIRPLALRIKPDSYQFAYFRVEDREPVAFKEKMEAKWSEFDESRAFKGGFLSEEMDLFYQFLFDLGSILGFIGFLALIITSLGFLGMVSFDLQSRIKEIGIRKVLGANFLNLVFSLSKRFAVVFGIATLIAFPLAVTVNNLWISEMASRSDLNFYSVGRPLLIIVLIVAMTIISQVWKNTQKDPANVLRTE